MQCSLCLKHQKNNAFTSSECTNYRTSTFVRHASTSDHTDALKAEALQKDFKQVCLHLILTFIYPFIGRQDFIRINEIGPSLPSSVFSPHFQLAREVGGGGEMKTA